MSGPLLFKQSAVRIRPGTRTDRAGNTIADWSEEAVSRLPLVHLNISPRGESTEEVMGTDRAGSGTVPGGVRIIAGWWLQTGPGRDADILPSDRVEFDDVLAEVQGEVARWPDPFTGQVHHIKVALKRVAASL